MATYLIDSPVSPFSPVEEIDTWLGELRGMDQDSPEVQHAIREAESDRASALSATT